MKTRIIIYGGLIIGLFALYVWWSAPRRETERLKSKQLEELIASNPIAVEVLTNAAAKSWVRPPGVSDADWREATAIRHMMLATNKKIEFHARAVDQDGAGINGVVFDLMLSGVDEEKVLREFPNIKMGSEIFSETIHLTTDSNGWVHLTGRRGRMVVVEGLKPGNGYLWQQNGYPSFDYDGGQALKPHEDPTKGYTFHLWKKGQTERLVKVACSVKVEPYGTNWYAMNLFDGQVQDVRAGDFRFWFETVKDDKGNLARKFRFEIVDGGLVLDVDPYSYLAPEGGYVSALDWYYEPSGRHANQDLQALMRKPFYVKARNGKVFGAITWHWAV